MNKPPIVIVGAGLCGSVVAARLRNVFDITVVEQGRKPHPLLTDIRCDTGGVTTTINRGEGLGGTTNYWHNVLIELAADELRDGGLDPARFAAQYQRAWAFFLSPAQRAESDRIGDTSAAAVRHLPTARMVVPQRRENIWTAAMRAWPGDPVRVVYGAARQLVGDAGTHPSSLRVDTPDGEQHLSADHYVLAAGGLATPSLLATSFRSGDVFCGGYHDHPMAYVAKLRLRSGSPLKRVSCVEAGAISVRAGFVYQARGLKAVFYLRPALNLKTTSITGDARYVLSDLRNDPFSVRKILALLGNIEAVREAVLFKSRAGYVGDYYSVLMLGEQRPLDSRGVRCVPGQVPALNWHVTDEEHGAYQECLAHFLDDIAGDLVDRNVIAADSWDYRTAAHHSGASSQFVVPPDGDGAGAGFAVIGAPGVSVCDASILRRGGIANSGLTLVALANQFADALIAGHT